MRTIIELNLRYGYDDGLVIRAATTTTGTRPASRSRNKELAAVPLEPHEFHGEWNYTITAQSIPAWSLSAKQLEARFRCRRVRIERKLGQGKA